MSLKIVHFTSEIVSSSIAFIANFVLIYLIKKHTTDELKLYSRILLQNCFVDLFFAFIAALSFLQLEVEDGVFIMILGGYLHNLPHPWNFFIQILFVFGLYFCVMCAAIPFYYRYVLIVKQKVMSLKKFYLLYAFSAFLSFTFQILLFIAFAPSVFGSNLEFRYVLDNDFWRDGNESLPIFTASNMAIVPLIGAALPMMSIIFTALFKLKVSHLTMLMVSGCSWITALNPLCAIFIVGPYRNAILRRNQVADSRIIHHSQGRSLTKNTCEVSPQQNNN